MASVGIGQVVDNVNIPRPTCININISLFLFLLHLPCRFALIPLFPLASL